MAGHSLALCLSFIFLHFSQPTASEAKRLEDEDDVKKLNNAVEKNVHSFSWLPAYAVATETNNTFICSQTVLVLRRHQILILSILERSG